MLPPKIGDGVFGSNSGGVKPTGASTVFSSVAATLTVRDAEKLRDLVLKGNDGDGFHGTRAWEVDLAVERDGVKRVA